jgi:DNA-binding NarL/FixJ family response regulator
MGLPRVAGEYAAWQAELRMAMLRMGEHRAAEARESGRSLSLDEAVDQALAVQASTTAPPVATRGQRGLGLTEREMQVVRLAAEGKTNREIAEVLILSDKTIKRHLDNVFAKLGVSSRTAAAAALLRSEQT